MPIKTKYKDRTIKYLDILGCLCRRIPKETLK